MGSVYNNDSGTVKRYFGKSASYICSDIRRLKSDIDFDRTYSSLPSASRGIGHVRRSWSSRPRHMGYTLKYNQYNQYMRKSRFYLKRYIDYRNYSDYQRLNQCYRRYRY